MKKELALALPLALAVPFTASASNVTVDGTSGSTSTTVVDSGTNSLSNLRTNGSASIQVSSGVYLRLEDSPGSVGAQDIAVTTCHEGGKSAFFGDTGGGAVQKNADFGTGNCTSGSAIKYTSVAST
ncbi:MAG TPA: hypothetical protein VKA48_12400 [Gammaproteobacteria bacterium]|nr:hypothetical protein [Gammaproteobacteria bacterium]